MSINYCTLASNTVDSFCSPRRGMIINRLIAELHPPVPVTVVTGGNTQQVRINSDAARRLAAQQRPNFEIDDREPLKYEQSLVTVAVEFLGASGSETQDLAGANVDFVTVTDLDLGAAAQEFVSITDFTIEQVSPLSDVNIKTSHID